MPVSQGSSAGPSSLQKLVLVRREAALVLMTFLCFVLKDASFSLSLGGSQSALLSSRLHLFSSSQDPPRDRHLCPQICQTRPAVLTKRTNMTHNQTRCRKEKKRKYHTFRCQFNEKPSIILLPRRQDVPHSTAGCEYFSASSCRRTAAINAPYCSCTVVRYNCLCLCADFV